MKSRAATSSRLEADFPWQASISIDAEIDGVRIAPYGVKVGNPAFDVTPHKYVTGIVTENGIAYPPFEVSLKRVAMPRD